MHSRNMNGSAAVLVAVSLLVLLAVASFAIDIGLGFDEKRDIQNAADNAALAAAFEQCNPANGVGNEAPAAAALAVADENGFTHNPPDVVVTPTPVPNSGGDWQVEIEVIDETQLDVSGLTPDELTIRATATADCVSLAAPGPYAVFAGAFNCGGASDQLNISSSDVDITGGVHTNGEINVTGGSVDITGETTFGEGTPVGYPAERLVAGWPVVYPIDVDASYFFNPAGEFYDAADTVGELWDLGSGNKSASDIASIGSNTLGPTTLTINTSGLYIVDGNLTVNKTMVIPAGVAVTFATTGQVDLAAVTHLGVSYSEFDGITPPSGIFIFSDHGSQACTGPAAIKLNGGGSGIQWTGTIFAPNGLIDISTNAANTISGDGSVIGWLVTMSGGSIDIVKQPTVSADPEFRLNLRE